jgi:enterochelin esterase-like enzyme
MPVTDIEELVSKIGASRSVSEVRRLESALRKIIQRDSCPVIRGDEAHFFFESETDEHIRIVGDWGRWKPSDKLTRPHARSRFYHAKKKFPVDARLAYRFLIDSQHSILDPLNPYSEQEVFGTNSVLRMPAYHSEPYAVELNDDIPRGKLREVGVPHTSEDSDNFTRTVQIYFPAHAKGLTKLPILYVHDGLETVVVGKFLQILDNLFFNEPRLPRCIVVFVPPRERDKEYMLNDAFAEWFAKSLVPYVEARFRLKPIYRGVAGASLGGLLSAYLGYRYSKVFNKIALQSPALWVQDDKIIQLYKDNPLRRLQFFLHTGTINDGEDDARAMLKVLQSKGYPTLYKETSESHNWGTWRGSYAEIVRWFTLPA